MNSFPSQKYKKNMKTMSFFSIFFVSLLSIGVSIGVHTFYLQNRFGHLVTVMPTGGHWQIKGAFPFGCFARSKSGLFRTPI